MFDLVAPQEYGIDPDEKEEIGVLTSLPLLHNVVQDLETARNNGDSSLTLYFTKVRITMALSCFVVTDILQGIPYPYSRELGVTFRFANREPSHTRARLLCMLSEATYQSTHNILQSHITFELYERNKGRGKSDKEYSIKLSLSEGAHSSNVLDSTLDTRHSLNVQSRK